MIERQESTLADVTEALGVVGGSARARRLVRVAMLISRPLQ